MSWGQIVRIVLLVSGAAIAWFGWTVHRDGENKALLMSYWDVVNTVTTIRVDKKATAQFSIPKSESWMTWSGGEKGRRLAILAMENVKIVRLRRNGSEIAFEDRNMFRAKPGDLIELELEATGPADQEIQIKAVEDLTETNMAAMTDGFMSIVGGLLMFFGAVLSLITLAIWVVIARRARAATSEPA